MQQHLIAREGRNPVPETAIGLTEAEREQIAAVNGNNDDLPVFEVYPYRRTDDGGVLLAGLCPLCGIEHTHGLNGFAQRRPHCSDQFPPFRNKPKPDWVRLRVLDAPIPDELRFALEVERPDLLAMAAVALPAPKPYGAQVGDLHDAHEHISAKGRKYTQERFAEATQALAACGIFDERAAIMIEEGHADPAATYRNLVADFIVKQGPAPWWRLRLARALKKAWVMRGKGEMVQ